uniref:Interleukin 26 n=1 Tax=Astyanax mexicanus TaxID=7994 RepID=A0A3B1IFU5_ASTMX
MRWMIWTLLTLAALIHSCPGERRKRSCAEVNCLANKIKPAMIKDMLHTVKSIKESLPVITPLIYAEKNRTIVVIIKLLKIYEDLVFTKLWKNDQEGPKDFTDCFHRLKDEVGHCVSTCSLLHATLGSEELLYAVGDFQTVLNWISIDSDPKLSVNKCQK